MAILQGLAQNGQSSERIERWGFQHFAAEGHQKRPGIERIERSGEFKGVKEGGEVFEVRGPGKATIVEISMSCKGVVQYVPESWLV